MTLEELIQNGEAPHWLTTEGYKTLLKGYLLPNETPKGMWTRVSKSAASRLFKPELEKEFFNLFWKNWLCGATPILSNMGTDRGLPISCYSIHSDDSVDGIFTKVKELALLSKHGGGVGVYLGDVRGRGSPIKGNGTSEGIVPWSKVLDQTTVAVAQGSTRRGATALYLPIEHLDIEEFINIRRPIGDPNRRCLNINNAVSIGDDFMNKVVNGDEHARKIWTEVIKARYETGEPYLFFKDNVNNQNPECYKQNNLEVVTSNLCSEIFLHTDPDHSFVCCLSSMNLARWDEWKDTNAVELAIMFLDAVMEEFITKANDIPGFECAVRFATKSRALGLGALGWHTLLQSKMIPFESFQAMQLNALIFKTIRDKAEDATRQLALEFGEPEWCKGFNRRNTHLLAIAPTVSNSLISGGVTQGIEPLVSNYFSQKSAKGTFIRKNPYLEKLLKQKNKDDFSVWESINDNDGSVQHLKFLSEDEKKVFLTAREINQFAIINQAAQRQKFIDQGQSVNLFFGINSDPKYINDVHIEAWKNGLKSLYYCRAESMLKGDKTSRQKEECESCQG